MQLEFYTQAHQMRRGIWEQNTHRALGLLAENGVISTDRAEALRGAYLYLRRVEAVLRRMDDTGISKLPTDESELQRIAMRLGYPGSGELLAEFDQMRQTIRESAVIE